MANWHYYNQNGEKIGPITVSALKELTRQGLITRDTIIENQQGRSAVAGQVNGLAFPESTPANKVNIVPSVKGEVYGVASSVPIKPIRPVPVPPPIIRVTNVELASPPQLMSLEPEWEQRQQQFQQTGHSSHANSSKRFNPLWLIVPFLFAVLLFPMLYYQRAAVREVVAQPVASSVTPMKGEMEHEKQAAGQTEIDKFREEYGNDIKAVDFSGGTLLHIAAWHGTIEDVKSLVSQGADVNAKTKDGNTPLHYVKDVEIAKYLIAQGANEDGITLFHITTWYGNIEDVKSFVSQGADVNAKTKDGDTPLHYVRDVEIAKFLVSKGADVKAKNKNGSTPLHGVYNVEIAKFFVSQGADVNAKNQHGKTPLSYVAMFVDKIEVIKFLVSKGADVNAKSDYGDTPLLNAMRAHREGLIEVVKFLVSQGADVNAKSQLLGETPLSGAVEIGDIEVVKFLVSHGADVKTGRLLRFAKDIEVVKFLVSQGASVTMDDDGLFGGSPLHHVTDVEIAKFLVSKGADVKAKNKNGSTPLHGVYNVEIAKFFVSQGADVNAKNNEGDTPLHRVRNDFEVIKFLVSQGADVNAKNWKGNTPLDIPRLRVAVAEGEHELEKEEEPDPTKHYWTGHRLAKQRDSLAPFIAALRVGAGI